MEEQVQGIVLKALEELSESFEEPVDLSRGLDTALFGDDAALSSLDLVSLLVAVEQTVEDETGATITLADERAFSRSRSPFQTVGTLSEYATELIGEQSS